MDVQVHGVASSVGKNRDESEQSWQSVHGNEKRRIGDLAKSRCATQKTKNHGRRTMEATLRASVPMVDTIGTTATRATPTVSQAVWQENHDKRDDNHGGRGVRGGRNTTTTECQR